MRKLFGILAAGALLFAGSTATAAPMVTTASLVVTIQNVGNVTLGGVGTVSITGSTVKVPAGIVAQATPIVIPVTGTTAIQSLTASGIANVSATFTPGGGTAGGELCPSAPVSVGIACNRGGGVGGAMGLVGTVNVRVNAFVNIPVKLSTALLGQGGAFVTPKSSISGDAGLWTTGTAVVGATTETTGGGTTQTSATTQGGPSPFTLVTPTFVNAFTGLAFLPLFGQFTLDNVSIPEPGTLLLLASGVAGLALVGRRQK